MSINGLDKIKVFSGAQLKYIAFLSMLIDHVNKALMYPLLTQNIKYIAHISQKSFANGKWVFKICE